MSAESASSQPVVYADGITPVLPGDRISIRHFLRRRPGEVIYVPGISKRSSSHEHDGLRWVGISLPNGWAVGTIVSPETGRLQSGVKFRGRGIESHDAAEAKRRIAEQEVEDVAREQEEAEEAARPVPKARPMDWLAGIVAVLLPLAFVMLLLGLVVGAVVLLKRWL